VRWKLPIYATFTDLGSVKNKRNEKAAKFSVPLPKVRGISEEETFKVVKTGKKTAKKGMPISFLDLLDHAIAPSMSYRQSIAFEAIVDLNNLQGKTTNDS
jgi:hypothetical protein